MASGTAASMLSQPLRDALDRAQTQVNVDTFGYGWGMAGGPTSTTMNIHEISVGTLLVDLVDAKSKQLVWRGIASGAVGVTISQEDMDDVAKRVFAGFPPPAGH